MHIIKDEVVRLLRIDGSIHIYIKSRNIDKLKSNYEIHKRLIRKAIIYSIQQVSIYNKDMNFDLCQQKGTIILNDFRNEK